MKLSHFILLSDEDKNKALLHLGILLAKRKSADLLVFLFQLDTFYVEMTCNLQDKTVHEYQVFTNPHLLEPYLENISLEGLL
ncbi:MAG TPA: hypothetical protein VGE66_00310 [Chitinophagaceae bacterium]